VKTRRKARNANNQFKFGFSELRRYTYSNLESGVHEAY
jgi:hypothetical protein